MYLKSIEVQGFKSFANKITFEFHNGITGIVGPNGSGKSNVADAVRWVLGEQSAKQLRGGNMQDVIFSGTETRRPLGFAYVAITMDNSDHKLPIDYKEVTIARRLYRSGESEYLLNGTSCRLKDVNELFYDTGIGKEGYSIIGQGQIDKILSGKPEERRELFDEAAGIVKFKRRKNTAIKKLEEEQQNLTRVKDILSELTRQVAPLEKQAETAKVYLKKKEALKKLDMQMFLAEMNRIRGELEETEKKYQIARADLEDTEKSFGITKTEYEKLEQELEKQEQEIQSLREGNTERTLEKQQLENQIHILKEQIHSAKQNESLYQDRSRALQADVEKRTEEEQEYLSEKEIVEEQFRAFEKVQSETQRAFKDLAMEIHSLEEKVEKGKNEIIEILNMRASTKGKLQRYDTMMEQISIRKTELNQKHFRLKSESALLNTAEKEYLAEKDEIQETIEGLKVVKAFTHEEEAKEKFQELNNAYRDAAQKANFYSTMIMPVAGNLMNISYALTAAFGGLLSVLQGFDLGGLAIYLNYSKQVGQPLNQISQQMTTLLSAMAGAERIFEVMDTAAEVNEGSVTLIPAEKDANGTLSPFTGAGRPRTWAWKTPRGNGMALVPVLVGEGDALTELGQAVREAAGGLKLLPPNVDSPEGIWVMVSPDGSLAQVADLSVLAGHGWAWKYPGPDGTPSLHLIRGTVRNVPGEDYCLTELKGAVRFRNVDFSYVPGKRILKDVSVYADPGQKIAFVVSAGAEGGMITYDGINVTAIRKDDLRRSLGAVLQDTHLFTGTIMDNIRYGRLDATDEECVTAAKSANAHSFIRRLPEGYQTMSQPVPGSAAAAGHRPGRRG